MPPYSMTNLFTDAPRIRRRTSNRPGTSHEAQPSWALPHWHRAPNHQVVQLSIVPTLERGNDQRTSNRPGTSHEAQPRWALPHWHSRVERTREMAPNGRWPLITQLLDVPIVPQDFLPAWNIRECPCFPGILGSVPIFQGSVPIFPGATIKRGPVKKTRPLQAGQGNLLHYFPQGMVAFRPGITRQRKYGDCPQFPFCSPFGKYGGNMGTVPSSPPVPPQFPPVPARWSTMVPTAHPAKNGPPGLTKQ